jgi:hypothetical protein
MKMLQWKEKAAFRKALSKGSNTVPSRTEVLRSIVFPALFMIGFIAVILLVADFKGFPSVLPILLFVVFPILCLVGYSSHLVTVNYPSLITIANTNLNSVQCR